MSFSCVISSAASSFDLLIWSLIELSRKNAQFDVDFI